MFFHMMGHTQGHLNIYTVDTHGFRTNVKSYQGDQGSEWHHFEETINGLNPYTVSIQLIVITGRSCKIPGQSASSQYLGQFSYSVQEVTLKVHSSDDGGWPACDNSFIVIKPILKQHALFPEIDFFASAKSKVELV